MLKGSLLTSDNKPHFQCYQNANVCRSNYQNNFENIRHCSWGNSKCPI